MRQDKPGNDREAEEKKIRTLTSAVQGKTPEQITNLLEQYGTAAYLPVSGPVVPRLVVSQIEDVLVAALTLRLRVDIDPELRRPSLKYAVIEVSDARVVCGETKEDHFSFPAPVSTSRAYRGGKLPPADYMRRIEKLGAWVNDGRYDALVITTPGKFAKVATTAPAAGDVLYFLMQYLTPTLRSALYAEGTAPTDISTTAVTAPFAGRILQVPRAGSLEPFVIERDITNAVADTIEKFATLKRTLNYHNARQKNAVVKLGPSKDERLGFTQEEKHLEALEKKRKMYHDAMHAAAIDLDRAANRRYGYGVKLKGLEDSYERMTKDLTALIEELATLIEEIDLTPKVGESASEAALRTEKKKKQQIKDVEKKKKQIQDAETAVAPLKRQITAWAKLRANVTGLDHAALHSSGADSVQAAKGTEIADERTRASSERAIALATNAYADAYDAWEAAETGYHRARRTQTATRDRGADVETWTVGQKMGALRETAMYTAEQTKAVQDKIHALPITDASIRTVTQLQQAFSGPGLTAEVRIRGISGAESRKQLEANTRPVEEKLYNFSLPEDQTEQAAGFFLRKDLVVVQMASVSIIRRGVQLPLAPGLLVGSSVTEGQSLTVPVSEAAITQTVERAIKPVTKKRISPEGSLARGIAPADKLYLNKLEQESIRGGKQTLLLTGSGLVYSTPAAVASFQIDGETFYATPVAAADGTFRPMSASGAANAVGSAQALLAGLGYLPFLGSRSKEQLEADLSNKQAREQIATIVTDTYKLRSKAIPEWLSGGRNMNLYRISKKAPKEAVDGYIPVTSGADASERTLIEKTFFAGLGLKIPAVSTAAKPVPIVDIARLQLYVMRQKRPVETADIKVTFLPIELDPTIDTLKKAASLANALARVTSIVLKLKAEYRDVQALAKSLSKEERGNYPTDKEQERAVQKASAFGIDESDLEYARTRAHTKILAALVHGRDEEMEAVNADPKHANSSPLAKIAVVISKDPALVARAIRRPLAPGEKITPPQLLAMSRPEDHADEGPVHEEIMQIRERMSTARVTEDPMFEYLLVAERKAHPLTHAAQGSVRLLLNTGTMSVMVGETGKALGLAIAWYQNAERVGYVPSEFPETGARGAARKMLQEVSRLSGVTGVAAARAGESTAPRGSYSAGVGQQGERSGYNVAPGLASIQAGKGSGSPSGASFGLIGVNSRSSSRLSIAVSRLPADIAAKAEIPVGRASSVFQRQLDKEALIAQEDRPLEIRTGREQLDARARRKQDAGADSSQGSSPSEGQSALDLGIGEEDLSGSSTTSSSSAGETDTRELTPDEYAALIAAKGDDSEERAYSIGDISNPRRYAYASRSLRRPSFLRRNPGESAQSLSDALRSVPEDLTAVYGSNGSAVRALAKLAESSGALLSAEEVKIFRASVCIPVTFAYGLLSAQRKAAQRPLNTQDLLKAADCLPLTKRGSILTGKADGDLPPDVNRTTLTELTRINLLFGPLYRTNLVKINGVQGFAAFDDTPAPIVAIGLVLGPLAQAYAMVLYDYGSHVTAQEREALTNLTQNPEIAESIQLVTSHINIIRAYDYAKTPLPGASRVLSKDDTGKLVPVTGTGLVLTAASRKMLSDDGLTASVPGDVMRIADARIAAESSYARFIELLKIPTTPHEALVSAKGAYETAARNLGVAISSRANEDTTAAAVSRDLVSARMTQFFAGRALAESPPESQSSRRTALRSLAVSARLDYYGSPVYPIDAEELTRRKLGAIDYGNDRTLRSRLSLSDVGKMITASPSQGGKTPAPSTLDCKPGIRGFKQFNRPFNTYTPPSWGQNSILNAIWLSPDGNYARIYRLGAPVCAFKRYTPPGGKVESLSEFLREISSNWTLWLNDPEHRRAAGGSKAFSNIIYVGQSGYPFMFRVNATGTQDPLAVNNFEKRLKSAGGAVAGDALVRDTTKTDNEHERLKTSGYQIEWSTSDTAVTADAEMFARALRDIGAVSNNETEQTLRKILRGTGVETDSGTAEPATGDSALLMFPSHRHPTLRGAELGGSAGVPTGVTDALSLLYGVAASAGDQARSIHVLDTGLFDLPLKLAIQYALSTGPFDVNDPKTAAKAAQMSAQYRERFSDATAAGFLLSKVVDTELEDGKSRPPFAFWVPGVNREISQQLAAIAESWADTSFPAQAATKRIGSPELVSAAINSTTGSIVIVNTWTAYGEDPVANRLGTLPMLIETVRNLKRSGGLGDGTYFGQRKIYYCNPPGTEKSGGKSAKVRNSNADSAKIAQKEILLRIVDSALRDSGDVLTPQELQSLFIQLQIAEWGTLGFNGLMREIAKLPAGDQGETWDANAVTAQGDEEEEPTNNPAHRASRYMAAAYQRTLPFAGWRNR